jgi:hypothetical protein
MIITEKIPTPASRQKLESKLRILLAKLAELDDDTVTENIIDSRIRMYDT